MFFAKHIFPTINVQLVNSYKTLQITHKELGINDEIQFLKNTNHIKLCATTQVSILKKTNFQNITFSKTSANLSTKTGFKVKRHRWAS